MQIVADFAERLIPPLANLSIVVGLWLAFGWGLAVGTAAAILIVERERKAERKRREWCRRRAAREAAWR